MSKVLIMDTSILCVWLKVPNMETCGPDNDRWDFEKVNRKVIEELAAKTTFVLPLASIIETGNHISQCPGDPYNVALSFADLIRKTANNETPWAAFTVQANLWSVDKLNELAVIWPRMAASRISLGDATIKDVADYYNVQGFSVEIFTGDQGLKAYEPIATPSAITTPRRRK
jgi:hypothetical protein